MHAVGSAGSERAFYAEQLAAAVLGELRSSAEAFLGTTVNRAVITVPAAFNSAQRRAIRVSFGAHSLGAGGPGSSRQLPDITLTTDVFALPLIT